VWAGAFGVPKGKLCAIRPGAVRCYGEDGSLGQWVWSLYEDSQGRLWAGAETGLWQRQPGLPRRYPVPHSIETAQALAEGSDGAVLLIAEGVWQFGQGRINEYPLTTPAAGLTTPVNVFRDRDGGLWIGTLQRGLVRVYQGQGSWFAQGDGLSDNRILCFFEDREGSIWVGTAEGLDRFRQWAVSSISMKQGLSSPSVWSVVAGRDGSVWLSTLDGLNRWNNGRVTHYHAANVGERVRAAWQAMPASERLVRERNFTEVFDPGLPDDRAGSLYEDDLGRIWVSTPVGIARFEGRRFTRIRELPAGWVNVISGDNHGGVWISYQDHGLVHWAGGKVVEGIPWSALGGNVIAAAVVSDPMQGGLWLGFFDGGLMYVKDGQVGARYGEKDGLGKGFVMGLQLDRDGTLWAATEGGLSRLKEGRIATLTTANGLPCDTVHWAEELDGSFWLYTPCGLLRVPRTELEAWSADPTRKVQFTIFDSSDGVKVHARLTGYTPHVSKAPDGKLWFAHFESVSVIDPLHLPVNQLPPPVHIEKITIDEKTYEAKNGLRLPPRVRSLAVDYTALSLIAPEKVRFRYKLENQNRNWHEVVNDREVQYTNLAPGTYRFLVKACNNSGLWNEDGASVEFVILPAWYQASWFRILCAATLLALLWAAYLLRIRHLAHQFNLTLEARVAERTRIARDLHDTLLQSFQGLLPRFQAAIHKLPKDAMDARTTLEAAVEQASAAIAEGRDAVQGLRLSTVESNDLALAIRTVGEELASANTVQPSPNFKVVVEGTTRNLHPILRDEIYRLAAEALRNAFCHAAAQNVEVEIRYDENNFRLRVRDDGKGIHPEVLRTDGREGHYGLHGMKERAALVGGKVTIWSEVGSGTEIELTISASKAYAKFTRPFWYFGKRFTKDPDVEETIERE